MTTSIHKVDLAHIHQVFCSKNPLSELLTKLRSASFQKLLQIGPPHGTHEYFTWISTRLLLEIESNSFFDVAEAILEVVDPEIDIWALSTIDELELEGDYFKLLNLAFISEVKVYKFSSEHKVIDLSLSNKPFSVSLFHLDHRGETNLILRSTATAANYSNHLCDISLAKDTVVKCLFLRNQSETSRELIFTNAHLDSGAYFELIDICRGSLLSRHSLDINLNAAQATADIRGLRILDKNRQSHTWLRMHHHQPDTFSDQLFRNVLSGQSQASFDGTVIVDPGAHGSKSAQLVNSLLLSENAKSSVKPNLLIYNDDVKCSHGATCGEPESEEIFYLLSRGFTESQAKQILSDAFIKAVLAKISNSTVQKALSEYLTGVL
jgi:Fe-S cluster assembly protein SufD